MNPSPLKQVCKQIKNVDPDLWDIFLKAFEEYSNDVTATVISAPPETIFQAQGRAQQCAVLMRLFMESTAK